MSTSTSVDPRRTLACNDITLPLMSNQTNSFFRRRATTQPHNTTTPLTTANTYQNPLDKSSSTSSAKSSLFDDNISNKTTTNTFSLLRHHSSPSNPHHKTDKSAYDNLSNATMPIDPSSSSSASQSTAGVMVTSTNLERKSSFPLHRKAHRHATNDSLASDAYDNLPDKNGYDNYPIRKTTTSTSMMSTSHNDTDGKILDRESSSIMTTGRTDFNTKRSQSINLKTPLTLKSNNVSGNYDEAKRSGSAHHRTNKSLTGTNKDPLCNLNAASCSPLNEHVSQLKRFSTSYVIFDPDRSIVL